MLERRELDIIRRYYHDWLDSPRADPPPLRVCRRNPWSWRQSRACPPACRGRSTGWRRDSSTCSSALRSPGSSSGGSRSARGCCQGSDTKNKIKIYVLWSVLGSAGQYSNNNTNITMKVATTKLGFFIQGWGLLLKWGSYEAVPAID